MPTYEYACKSCGEHLEVVQSFKDDALSTCAACGGPLRKVFGSIGISFKGSGFYKNDSRSSSSSTSPAKPAETGGSKSGEPAASAPAPSGDSSSSSTPSPSTSSPSTPSSASTKAS